MTGVVNAIMHGISIHAPREGCDTFFAACDAANNPEFQSTHPVRGATSTSYFRNLPQRISIHAPREGCDS